MAKVVKKDGLTGKVIVKQIVPSVADGMAIAKDLLSIHLVEFDEIQSTIQRGVVYYSIMHFDGTYAPIEVQVLKR